MERNSNLDIIKFISCFFVIFIHSFVQPSVNFGAEYIKALSRVAVPLFFMISGYYYPFIQNKGRQLKQLKKIIILTLFSTIFYTVFSFNNINFSTNNLMNWIVFNADPLSMHLWYLYALIYVLLFILLFGKKLMKHSALISFLLILVNYSLSYGSNFCLYRNFLFTGLPYFLLGFSIQKEQRKKLRQYTIKYKWVITPLLIIMLWGEFYIYQKFGLNPNRDHFFMLYPLSAYVFYCAVSLPNKYHGCVAYIGQHYTTGIYIFHIFMMSATSFIVYNFIGADILESIENNYVYPFIIMVNCILFVFLYRTTYKFLKSKIE